MKTAVTSANSPAPVGPYSLGIKAAGLVFLSGQISIDPATGTQVKDSIEAETAQVMKNVGGLLAAAGCDFGDIVKCSVFVSDMDDFDRINAVYATFFEGHVPPARELVQVARLPKDANIEISVIALQKQS